MSLKPSKRHTHSLKRVLVNSIPCFANGLSPLCAHVLIASMWEKLQAQDLEEWSPKADAMGEDSWWLRAPDRAGACFNLGFQWRWCSQIPAWEEGCNVSCFPRSVKVALPRHSCYDICLTCLLKRRWKIVLKYRGWMRQGLNRLGQVLHTFKFFKWSSTELNSRHIYWALIAFKDSSL